MLWMISPHCFLIACSLEPPKHRKLLTKSNMKFIYRQHSRYLFLSVCALGHTHMRDGINIQFFIFLSIVLWLLCEFCRLRINFIIIIYARGNPPEKKRNAQTNIIAAAIIFGRTTAACTLADREAISALDCELLLWILRFRLWYRDKETQFSFFIDRYL
jgi:hypothetical protein